MDNWKTPMGLKINCFEVNEERTQLTDLIALTKSYHKGLYVIGHDTTYCEQPHYHIHWWCEKEVTKGAVKTFRSTKIKGYDRSLKFYLGQELPSADKCAWLGYAVKENIIEIDKFPDDIRSQIIKTAEVQKEIKVLKQIHSEKLKEKDKVKKELKDKLFLYIVDNKEHYIIEHKEMYHNNWGVLDSYKLPDLIRHLIIKYFVQEDKYWYIQKTTIDRYLKEYLGKYENYNEKNFFSMLYT